jgi:hypothetical protein
MVSIYGAMTAQRKARIWQLSPWVDGAARDWLELRTAAL